MSGRGAIDLSGQRFGKLLALREHDIKSGHRRWMFRCDCGAELPIFKSQVMCGQVKSCTACGRQRQARGITKHGLSRSSEYQTYHAARQRCLNPRDSRYADYGGRGIEFRFRSFEEFYAALGPRPAGKYLDRRDNNKHYEAGNLHWVTPKESALNRRDHPLKGHKSPPPERPRTKIRRLIWAA
jgi:hypothetical protein